MLDAMASTPRWRALLYGIIGFSVVAVPAAWLGIAAFSAGCGPEFPGLNPFLGKIIIGAGVSISTTNDAGAVVAWVPETGTTVNNMPIGSAMTVQADTEKGIVFLRLEN